MTGMKDEIYKASKKLAQPATFGHTGSRKYQGKPKVGGERNWTRDFLLCSHERESKWKDGKAQNWLNWIMSHTDYLFGPGVRTGNGCLEYRSCIKDVRRAWTSLYVLLWTSEYSPQDQQALNLLDQIYTETFTGYFGKSKEKRSPYPKESRTDIALFLVILYDIPSRMEGESLNSWIQHEDGSTSIPFQMFFKGSQSTAHTNELLPEHGIFFSSALSR